MQHSSPLRCSRPGLPGAPACSRRNERERQRVRQVNLGFQALRQHVPPRGEEGAPRRLSKVQTLRAALNYIRGLQELLRGTEDSFGSEMEEGESSSESGREEREAEEPQGTFRDWFYNY